MQITKETNLVIFTPCRYPTFLNSDIRRFEQFRSQHQKHFLQEQSYNQRSINSMQPKNSLPSRWHRAHSFIIRAPGLLPYTYNNGMQPKNVRKYYNRTLLELQSQSLYWCQYFQWSHLHQSAFFWSELSAPFFSNPRKRQACFVCSSLSVLKNWYHICILWKMKH